MILVISTDSDSHANAVMASVAAQGGSATLLDLSHFPQRMQLAISYTQAHSSFVLARSGDTLDLARCSAIWWRRPQPFELHPELGDPTNRSFAYTECHFAISGLWLNLDAFWVNHPTLDEKAGQKVFQLETAKSIGLEIPRTLITNDPDRANEFIETAGADKTVFKAFSGTEQAWRETRVLRAGETALIDSVRYAPVIFQEYIPAQYDLRVTVVGSEIFAAAIYANETGYEFDYRMDMDRARIEQLNLPPDLIDRLHAYVHRLGLIYGAIDLRLTPDGRYVFLEINPSGQWLFIEERTGQPITETFANLLLEHDR